MSTLVLEPPALETPNPVLAAPTVPPLTSVPVAPAMSLPRVTKKTLSSDHPTWCPGCGDFSVLALFYKLIEKVQLPQENLVIVSGIGCSSRFPYFIQAHGAHFIHGRSLPFASGVSLARPDLHVFVFGGDGDLFSIGGNHFTHTARKNIRMTVVCMDNWVYGMTKKQTSPTSPLGYKSKTDIWGAVDEPLNPMKQALAAGATFVARTAHTNPNHVLQMLEAAQQHNGFSFIEYLSECVEFYRGAFDGANPRKGGSFPLVPADHKVTDEAAAYKLAGARFPGYFGVFYQTQRATKNQVEADLAGKYQMSPGLKDWQILQRTFAKMK